MESHDISRLEFNLLGVLSARKVSAGKLSKDTGIAIEELNKLLTIRPNSINFTVLEKICVTLKCTPLMLFKTFYGCQEKISPYIISEKDFQLKYGPCKSMPYIRNDMFKLCYKQYFYALSMLDGLCNLYNISRYYLLEATKLNETYWSEGNIDDNFIIWHRHICFQQAAILLNQGFDYLLQVLWFILADDKDIDTDILYEQYLKKCNLASVSREVFKYNSNTISKIWQKLCKYNENNKELRRYVNIIKHRGYIWCKDLDVLSDIFFVNNKAKKETGKHVKENSFQTIDSGIKACSLEEEAIFILKAFTELNICIEVFIEQFNPINFFEIENNSICLNKAKKLRNI